MTALRRGRLSHPNGRPRHSSYRPTSSPASLWPSTPCDLAGQTIGVQQGNTSQRIADRLVAEGKAAAVRVYDYDSIRSALTDLTTGACDAFMKLAPVLTELVRPVPGVEVVQRGISVENIAIAVPLEDQGLLRHIAAAQEELEQDGTLQRIRRKWLGNPYTDQSLTVH
jgi:polar amino acid transport system substrate-binding protein